MDTIKNNIIQITIHEIEINNYENISLRNLVKKVHLTTGAFYKRFPNKRSLFLNVAQDLSSQIYHLILPKVGNYQNHPRQSLVQLGSSIIELLDTKPNIMNFLFFYPELLEACKNEQVGMKFSFLKLAKQIISLNIDDENQVNREFIKLWSFIMGYCNLISNHVCEFDPNILTETLNQMLGDDYNE